MKRLSSLVGVCVGAALLAACSPGNNGSFSPAHAPAGPTVSGAHASPAYGVIYSFGKVQGDGSNPFAGLTQVNGALYGTTQMGGTSGQGTVFKTITSGYETVLTSFDGSDGEYPSASLTDVNGTLYGTITEGGQHSNGAVFAISSGKERLLHSFGVGSRDGATPDASLIDVNGTLYGTTRNGGKHYVGTVFSITPSGKETVLYSFDGPDGDQPLSALVNVNGALYGTTTAGGSNDEGTVFSITPSGKETVLYSFASKASDGHRPAAGLVNVDGTLYGTTTLGGGIGCAYKGGCGTVFKITTSGNERVVYHFTGGLDGESPTAGLLNVDGTLYGTTELGGGSHSYGTVFKVSLSGTEKVLHRFSGSDGRSPVAPLIDVKGTLYGTTSEGGKYECTGDAGCGVIFYLSP